MAMLGGALAVPPVLLTGPYAGASDVRLTASAALTGGRTLAREQVLTYDFTVRAHGGVARDVRLRLSAPSPLSWGDHPAGCAAAGRRLRCSLGNVERSRRLRVDLRVPRTSRLARVPALTAVVTAGNAVQPSRLSLLPPPGRVPPDVPAVPKVPDGPKFTDAPKSPPELDSTYPPDVTIPSTVGGKPRGPAPKHRPKGKVPLVSATPKEHAPKEHAPKEHAPKQHAPKKKRHKVHKTPKLKGTHESPTKRPSPASSPAPGVQPTTQPSAQPSNPPSNQPDPEPRPGPGAEPGSPPSIRPSQEPSATASPKPSGDPSDASGQAPGAAPGAGPQTVPAPSGQLPPPPAGSPSPPLVAPPIGQAAPNDSGMTLVSPVGMYGENGTSWLIVLGMVVVAEVALLWLATCLALLRSRLTESMALRAARRTYGDH